MLDHLKCLNTISNIFQMKVDRFWSCQLFGIIGRWFSNSNEKDLSKVCLPIWNYISMWMWIAKGDILWKYRFVKFIFVNCMSGTWNDQCFRELKAKQLQWLKKYSQKYFIIFTGSCTTLVKQQRIFILSFVCVLQYTGCYISYLIKYFKSYCIKFHNKQELLHSQKRRYRKT